VKSANWIHFGDRRGEVWVAALRGVDGCVAETDMPAPEGQWRFRVVLRSGRVLTDVSVSENHQGLLTVVLSQAADPGEWAGARIEIEAAA
jgi:hypothetical protein